MTRDEFLQGQPYRMPPAGMQPCSDHNWKLEHCERAGSERSMAGWALAGQLFTHRSPAMKCPTHDIEMLGVSTQYDRIQSPAPEMEP